MIVKTRIMNCYYSLSLIRDKVQCIRYMLFLYMHLITEHKRNREMDITVLYISLALWNADISQSNNPFLPHLSSTRSRKRVAI